MAYEIRIFKLVTGEVVMGKYEADKDVITDVANLQTVPMQQGGVQMLLLPYGYPFENTFCGTIDLKNVLYHYKETPEELQNKYIEAATNLTVAGGMGKLQFGATPGGSGLIK